MCHIFPPRSLKTKIPFKIDRVYLNQHRLQALDGLLDGAPRTVLLTLPWHSQPKQRGLAWVGLQNLVQGGSQILVLADTCGPPVVAEAVALRWQGQDGLLHR